MSNEVNYDNYLHKRIKITETPEERQARFIRQAEEETAETSNNDNHAKSISSLTTTSSHQIIVKSVSGLKWFDEHNLQLSALSLIQTTTISSYISSAKAIMLLIGTNFTRSITASKILKQIKNFIYFSRSLHSHLTDKDSIIITETFPCYKTSYSLPSCTLLQENIRSYNDQLIDLSNILNFKVLNFQFSVIIFGLRINVDRSNR